MERELRLCSRFQKDIFESFGRTIWLDYHSILRKYSYYCSIIDIDFYLPFLPFSLNPPPTFLNAAPFFVPFPPLNDPLFPSFIARIAPFFPLNSPALPPPFPLPFENFFRSSLVFFLSSNFFNLSN